MVINEMDLIIGLFREDINFSPASKHFGGGRGEKTGSFFTPGGPEAAAGVFSV